MINGANKYGYDKAALPDRVKWVRERHDLILSFADDPVSNAGWRDADCPFQFLAFCLEYAQWAKEGDAFVSHLPVGMDGSCNGLQNFSAMLRDEVGGKATNLIPGELPNDIYQMVADVTTRRLVAANDDPEHDFKQKWLKHKINRKLVKRSVMTLPYGSTRFSCSEFIVQDYLKAGLADDVFEKQEYAKASRYLAGFVWDSIGDVVVKAREAMSWLQLQARLKIKSGEQVIKWIAPSGFPVVQDYREQNQYRIRTRLCGNAFIRMNVETSKPDINRHKNGIAPNFIHSCDAAHLTLVTIEAAERGLDLAMIHDDYGTHAADAHTLFTLIRSVFVRMYQEHSPLEEFDAYPDSEKPPECGTLNLEAVKSSLYFFS
jgi:DNA-directed RNA polymerase